MAARTSIDERQRAQNDGMALSASFWQRVKRVATGALFPRYWMAVIVQEPLKIVINSDGRQVTADGTARTVHTEDKTLARFDAIQSIDVVHHPPDDGAHKPEHWSVHLYLGRSTRSFIGRSRKHGEARKAATLLGTITGQPVRSLEALTHPSHIPSR
jgi:hypothetical protein